MPIQQTQLNSDYLCPQLGSLDFQLLPHALLHYCTGVGQGEHLSRVLKKEWGYLQLLPLFALWKANLNLY